jgi:hypothetical protein
MPDQEHVALIAHLRNGDVQIAGFVDLPIADSRVALPQTHLRTRLRHHDLTAAGERTRPQGLDEATLHAYAPPSLGCSGSVSEIWLSPD